MTRRTITVCLGLALLLAAAALAGCSRKGTSGQKTDTGFFTGYEMGNEQDQAEIRKDRPGYRPHE
ncbi:MAG: hypothetical protein ACYSWT_05010 [Planctomycetota bacterium]|jgi:ABC-type oligopeptide transport system substrate-binding subunit